jgi:hypothetical protein
VEAGGGPGPAIGAALPALGLVGHDGERRTLAAMRGSGGLLLNFNRSVVW